ncbi:hypothetical protein [Actinoplanes sp. NPDC026670]|uniref:hypothetical protein n=1 Tax=Actinoplanes sp. NPDC026670 TaxID=3154700 RepID=UPI0033DBBF8C
MDLHIPDDPEYQWAYTAILIASGEQLPKADITQLRAMTAELNQVVAAMMALSTGMGGLSTSVFSAVSGPTAREFYNATRNVTDGVPDDINLLRQMIAQADDFTLDAEQTQYSVAIAMFLTVFDIFLALVSGFGYLVPFHIAGGGGVVRALIQGLKLRHVGRGLSKLHVPPLPKAPKALPKVTPKDVPKPTPKTVPKDTPTPKPAPKPKDTPTPAPKDPVPPAKPPMTKTEQAFRYGGEIVEEAVQEGLQEMAEEGVAMGIQTVEGNRKVGQIDWNQWLLAGAGGAMIGGVAAAWSGAVKKILPNFADGMNGRAINGAIGEVLGELGFTSIVGGDFVPWATVTSSMLGSYGVDYAHQVSNNLAGVPEGGVGRGSGGPDPVTPQTVQDYFTELSDTLRDAGGDFAQLAPVVDALGADVVNEMTGQPLTNGPADPAGTPTGTSSGGPAGSPSGVPAPVDGGGITTSTDGPVTAGGAASPPSAAAPETATNTSPAPSAPGSPSDPQSSPTPSNPATGTTAPAPAPVGPAVDTATAPPAPAGSTADTTAPPPAPTGSTTDPASSPPAPGGSTVVSPPVQGGSTAALPPVPSPVGGDTTAPGQSPVTPSAGTTPPSTVPQTGGTTTTGLPGFDNPAAPGGTGPASTGSPQPGNLTPTPGVTSDGPTATAPSDSPAATPAATQEGQPAPFPATQTVPTTTTAPAETTPPPAPMSEKAQEQSPPGPTTTAVSQQTTTTATPVSPQITTTTTTSVSPQSTTTTPAPVSQQSATTPTTSVTGQVAAPVNPQTSTTAAQNPPPPQQPAPATTTQPAPTGVPPQPVKDISTDVDIPTTPATEATEHREPSTEVAVPAEAPPEYRESPAEEAGPPVYEAKEPPPPAYTETTTESGTPDGGTTEHAPSTGTPEKAGFRSEAAVPALAWTDGTPTGTSTEPTGPIHVPAGLRLIDSATDPAHFDHAGRAPHTGTYQVFGHGTPDGVTIGPRTIGAAELAAMIKADPAWDNRPIRLIACDTGAGPLDTDRFVNELRRHLPGVRIDAPRRTAWTTADGDVFVAGTRIVGGRRRPDLTPHPDNAWSTGTASRNDGETDESAETIHNRPVVESVTASNRPPTEVDLDPDDPWAIGIEIETRFILTEDVRYNTVLAQTPPGAHPAIKLVVDHDSLHEPIIEIVTEPLGAIDGERRPPAGPAFEVVNRLIDRLHEAARSGRDMPLAEILAPFQSFRVTDAGRDLSYSTSRAGPAIGALFQQVADTAADPEHPSVVLLKQGIEFGQRLAEQLADDSVRDLGTLAYTHTAALLASTADAITENGDQDQLPQRMRGYLAVAAPVNLGAIVAGLSPQTRQLIEDNFPDITRALALTWKGQNPGKAAVLDSRLGSGQTYYDLAPAIPAVTANLLLTGPALEQSGVPPITADTPAGQDLAEVLAPPVAFQVSDAGGNAKVESGEPVERSLYTQFTVGTPIDGMAEFFRAAADDAASKPRKSGTPSPAVTLLNDGLTFGDALAAEFATTSPDPRHREVVRGMGALVYSHTGAMFEANVDIIEKQTKGKDLPRLTKNYLTAASRVDLNAINAQLPPDVQRFLEQNSQAIAEQIQNRWRQTAPERSKILDDRLTPGQTYYHLDEITSRVVASTLLTRAALDRAGIEPINQSDAFGIRTFLTDVDTRTPGDPVVAFEVRQPNTHQSDPARTGMPGTRERFDDYAELTNRLYHQPATTPAPADVVMDEALNWAGSSEPTGPVHVPGGLRLIDAGTDPAHFDHAGRAPRTAVYQVYGHGTPDGIRIGTRTVGAAELAAMIKADPAWNGRPVRLIACDTGAGRFVTDLRRHLPGVRVDAPLRTAWTTADGGVFVAGTTVSGGRRRPDLTAHPDNAWSTGAAHRNPDETDESPETVARRPVTETTYPSTPTGADLDPDDPWAIGVEIETQFALDTPGDVDVGYATVLAQTHDGIHPAIKLVMDHSGGEQIIEIVTEPLGVIDGEQRPPAPPAFQLINDLIDRLHQVTATGRNTPLAEALSTLPQFRVSDVGSQVGVIGGQSPKQVYTQYTVGVPLAGMPEFLTKVVEDTRTRNTREPLEHGLEFARRLAEHFGTGDPHLNRLVQGIGAMAYTHTAAILSSAADLLESQRDGKPVERLTKNYLGAASRVQMSALNAQLPPVVQRFLEENAEAIGQEVINQYRRQAPDKAALLDGKAGADGLASVFDVDPRARTLLLNTILTEPARAARGVATIDQSDALGIRTHLTSLDHQTPGGPVVPLEVRQADTHQARQPGLAGSHARFTEYANLSNHLHQQHGAAPDVEMDDALGWGPARPPSLYTLEEEPENDAELARAIERALPGYLRESRQLGLAKQAPVQARIDPPDLTALVPGLDPEIHEQLRRLMRDDVDKFLGDGHAEPVVVDGKPADLVIRAVFDTTGLTASTKDAAGGKDLKATGKDTGKTTSATSVTDDQSLNPRAAVAALPPLVADIAVTVPMAASTGSAHTGTVEDTVTRTVKLKNGVPVDMPLRYIAELRDPGGRPLGDPVTADGRVDLVVPRDLRRPRGAASGSRPPAGAVVESATARPGPAGDFFTQVAAKLDLDADGKRALREFLSDRNLQKELHTLERTGGWVTSDPLTVRPSRNPLRGPRSTAVRMRLVPRLTRVVETVDDAEHEVTTAHTAQRDDNRNASRTVGISGGAGAGTEAGAANFAVGPRAGFSRTTENGQEHSATVAGKQVTTSAGPMTRFQVVYDLEVALPGGTPQRLDGVVDSFQWTTPDRLGDEAWPGLHGDDREVFAPPNLEHGISFDGSIPQLGDTSGLFDAIAAALRDVPGKPRLDHSLFGLFLSENDLLGDMGDPRHDGHPDADDRAGWRRTDEVRATLSEDHLVTVLNRIIGPGLKIPVRYAGVRHDYPTIITITGVMGPLSDGPTAGRRADGTATRLKEKSSTVSGRGTTTTAEIGVEGRLYGPAAKLYGTLLAGIRFARTSTRAQKLGLSQGATFHLDHGTKVKADGTIDKGPVRAFATELTLTVRSESYRTLNTVGRRTSIGGPGRDMPAPVRPAAVAPQTHTLPVRLYVPDDRTTRTRPPARRTPRPVTSEPIGRPNPVTGIGGGYSRDLDGNRLTAFTASPALEAATMRVLRAASGGDPLFDSGATTIPLTVAEALSPESMTSSPSLFSSATEITGLAHERRTADTTAQAAIRLRPANPRIIDTGGYRKGKRSHSGGTTSSNVKGRQFEAGATVTGVGSVAHTPLPAGLLRYVPGGIFVGQLVPLSRKWGRSRGQDLSGGSRLSLTGRAERMVLVQLDLDAEVTAEVHENPWHPGHGRTRSAAEHVLVPDGVQMWMTEAQYHRLRAHDAEFAATRADIETAREQQRERDGLDAGQRQERDTQRQAHTGALRDLSRRQEQERAAVAADQRRELRERRDELRRQQPVPAGPEPGGPAPVSVSRELDRLREQQRDRLRALDENHTAAVQALTTDQERAQAELLAGHRDTARDMSGRHNDDLLRRLDERTARAVAVQNEAPKPEAARKVPDGLLPSPPVARPAGAVPVTGAPSVGIGGSLTPIDLGDRLDHLRSGLVKGLTRQYGGDEAKARQTAERLLPRDGLARPHDNSRAVREFLSNLHGHLPGGLNGGRTQPLRLEDRLTGHTYYLAADITFAAPPAGATVAHVDQLGVSGKVEIADSVVRSRWRQKLGGSVTARFNQTLREPGTPAAPRAGSLGMALRGGLKWGTRDRKDTTGRTSVHKQALTATGPVAAWRGQATVELSITRGDRHLGRDGRSAGAVLATDVQTREVEFHSLPGDTLPAPRPGHTRLGQTGPILTVDRAGHTEAARERWRTADGTLRLPDEPDAYAVERLLPDMAALRAAAAQAILDSGGDVDDDTIAALDSALTPDTMATALRAMTGGTFAVPLPIGADRYLYVDARILSGSARLAGADHRITIKSSVSDDHKHQTEVKHTGVETAVAPVVAMAAGSTHGAQRRDFQSVMGSTQADRDLLTTGSPALSTSIEHGHKLAGRAATERPEKETLTRGLLYDVGFRFSVSGKPGVFSDGSRHTGGTEVLVTDAVLLRVRDSVAVELTGSTLPDGLTAAAQTLADASQTYTDAAARTDAVRRGGGAIRSLAAAEAAENAAARTWEKALRGYGSALHEAQQPPPPPAAPVVPQPVPAPAVPAPVPSVPALTPSEPVPAPPEPALESVPAPLEPVPARPETAPVTPESVAVTPGQPTGDGSAAAGPIVPYVPQGDADLDRVLGESDDVTGTRTTGQPATIQPLQQMPVRDGGTFTVIGATK